MQVLEVAIVYGPLPLGSVLTSIQSGQDGLSAPAGTETTQAQKSWSQGGFSNAPMTDASAGTRKKRDVVNLIIVIASESICGLQLFGSGRVYFKKK